MDLLFDLERRFDAENMQETRKLAAKSLKQNATGAEIEPVLDFFETLGVLVRRHAIDPEFAWSSFSYWVLRYSALARERIEARRREEKDPTYYGEFELLARRFQKIDEKKRSLKSPPVFSKKQLEDFLDEEAKA